MSSTEDIGSYFLLFDDFLCYFSSLCSIFLTWNEKLTISTHLISWAGAGSIQSCLTFLKCLKVTVSAKSGAAVTLWSLLNHHTFGIGTYSTLLLPILIAAGLKGVLFALQRKGLYLSLKNAPSHWECTIAFPSTPEPTAYTPPSSPHTIAWVSETSIPAPLGWGWQAWSMLPSLPSNLRSPPSSLLSPLQSSTACIIQETTHPDGS